TSLDRGMCRARSAVGVERFGESQILRREGGDLNESLATRRLVEQAKKMLVTRLRISEAEAFLRILERQLSTRRSLRETAWTIIEAEGVLSRVDFTHCLQLIFHVVRQDLRVRSERLML